MPTVNVYHKSKSDSAALLPFISKLKVYIANKLTCGDKELTSDEISIRFITVEGDAMVGNVELEITAHAFKERVDKQDEICREVREYLMKEVPSLGDIRVWLKLCELGHSW